MSSESDLSDAANVSPQTESVDLEDLALDEDYALTSEFVDMVIDAADRGDGARLAELVEAGELTPVTVEGWGKPAYLHPQAKAPRKLAAQALLSPFDNLIWTRERTERLFGVRVRLEIYTPAHKREHGYYVLPLLQGEQVTARVDLKADRAGRALLVQAAHCEPGADEAAAVDGLVAELTLMAAWLGLERVRVIGAGDLAAALGERLGRRS